MEKGTGVFKWGWIVPLAGLLLAAACAAPPATTVAVTQPTAPSNISSGSEATSVAPSSDTVADTTLDLPPISLDETFLSGYGAITAKYIDHTTPAKLARQGLQGLAAIDPGLSLHSTTTDLALYHNGMPVAQHPSPATDDIKAWVALTVALIEAAKDASPDLAAASQERIYEAVFDAALSDLDIFSRYAGAEEARKNRAKRDGFGGIGLHFRTSPGGLLITKVLVNTPADKAGLQEGDVITAIDGAATDKMSARAAGYLMRGPILSHVTLTIRSAGETADMEPTEHTLVRAHIIPNTVTSRIENDLLYIKVDSFNSKTASALEEKLTASSTVKGIVLDLRGNPGGLLRQSIDVADLFLAKGRIMSTAGRHPDSVQVYRANGRDSGAGLPLAVILDSKSASAAEVVAAALQDQGRAVVIGATSYGKGTVQTVIRLPNDGEITLTWSRLVSPSGHAFHDVGIPPAVCTSNRHVLSDTDGRALVTAALDLNGPVAHRVQAWRQLERAEPADEAGARHTLRASCPPDRQASARVPESGTKSPQTDRETRIAALLLADESLYARAVKLFQPPTDTAAVPR